MKLLYDRGTITLQDVPPRADAASLPGVLWDRRTLTWRAPGWRYGDLLTALGQTGVDCCDDVRPSHPQPARFEAPSLRPYQAAALAAWHQAGGRGVVVLPTGAGKTRTAIAAIASAGLRTLCLAPTRVLLAQWRRALLEAGARPVGQFGDGVRQWAPITAATYASAMAHADGLGNRFDLLVLDEAHHFGGGHGDEILELYVATQRLGLTATPPEEDARRARLEQLVGPTVYRSSVDQLAGRWLAPFHINTITLDLTADERRAYLVARQAFTDAHRHFCRHAPDATWAQFVAAMSRSEAGRRALSGWRRSREIVAFTHAKQSMLTELLARHTDGRTLIFAPDNHTAYRIARTQLVTPITCEISPRERDAALQKFAAGSLRALVSTRVLNEGLDVPDADVGVLVGGQQGTREYVQRVGRLLRPAAGKEALVYELVTRDTHEVAQVERGRMRLAAA